MDELLTKAFEALKTLPAEDRERIAFEILERVEDKTEWDRLIASPEAQAWMERSAKKALKIYDKIAKKMSMKFVSLGLDNLLREGTYWETFDDLPEDVRKLAEKNYQLWKDNPKNVGLRFKQIHPSLPVYSFRVGLKHRTVGIETPDGKVAWFWVGSFNTFKSMIEA
ncbi:hypothetical protein [Magnetovibrio sp.]|uniref:hypothetical protein n=1 Tax=Magnetovibrio sp. TaxID=2024836 RepID=UPI002F93ABAA